MRGRRNTTDLVREQLLARRIIDARGCWLWQGATSDNGYGTIIKDRKYERAHRLSYEIFVGPVPAGQVVRHKCDVTNCINPAHLAVGTQADNIRDAVSRGRHAHRESHPAAKLTEMKVAEIRRLAATGMSQGKIGAAFGIRQQQVSKIVTGQHWPNQKEKAVARKKLQDPVLAEGEVTGHAHRVAGVSVFEEQDGTRTFSARRSVTVTHEEHGPIVLPKGKFTSARVREYDHFAEEARQVAD